MSERNSIADIIDIINSESVTSHNTPDNFFACCTNKNKSESIWIREPVSNLKKKLTFTYKLSGRKDKRYYKISVRNSDVANLKIPDSAEIKIIPSDTLYTHVIFHDWNESLTKFIRDICVYFIETFEPSDKFGCCSKYRECSQARKCLHYNQFYAKACWYRKNIQSGNIFY